LQRGDAFFYDATRRAAIDLGDEPNATGVVFVGWVI